VRALGIVRDTLADAGAADRPSSEPADRAPAACSISRRRSPMTRSTGPASGTAADLDRAARDDRRAIQSVRGRLSPAHAGGRAFARRGGKSRAAGATLAFQTAVLGVAWWQCRRGPRRIVAIVSSPAPCWRFRRSRRSSTSAARARCWASCSSPTAHGRPRVPWGWWRSSPSPPPCSPSSRSRFPGCTSRCRPSS
jgi:hypothetical protein